MSQRIRVQTISKSKLARPDRGLSIRLMDRAWNMLRQSTVPVVKKTKTRQDLAGKRYLRRIWLEVV